MGRAAAADIAGDLRVRLAAAPAVRVIFASAPSQSEMLNALAAEEDIDWPRVEAFHMDDYIGLDAAAPQRFSVWLENNFFNRIPIGAFQRIEPDPDPIACARDYTELLARAPIDIVCLGIGVNGHLAFNDPPDADFDDPDDVRIVALDAVSRQQQVDDACFDTLSTVPTHAVTLTIPRLLRSDRMVCVVPGRAKRDAARKTLHGPFGPAVPATALRRHPHCTLYLDQESDPDG
ncbi:MAG: glucosamine-6-phosphate deaminase [Hyphomicrobiales bacterium]|nr:glucosamine-6-phosphate deaminase [Hyphomicrobiales bacterium]